jgi:hypothetical protein
MVGKIVVVTDFRGRGWANMDRKKHKGIFWNDAIFIS